MFEGYLRRDVEFYRKVWRTAMTTAAPAPFSVKARD
jgi:hypothetical protein